MNLSKRQFYGLLAGGFAFLGLLTMVLALSANQRSKTNATAQTTLPGENREIAQGPREKYGSVTRIEVPATVMWFDTGIDITGKEFRIDYDSGEWTNVVGSNFCDGQGKGPYPNLLLANAPLSSLVGKTGSGIFYVGHNYHGIGQKGKLYLSLNDKPGFFNDNAGALFVVVSFIEK